MAQRDHTGGSRPYGDKRNTGDKRSYGEKRAEGDKRPYGDKRAEGDKRPYGDKRAEGNKRPYGDKRAEGNKRPYGDKRAEGDKRPYGDKRNTGDKRPYGDKRPPRAEKPAPAPVPAPAVEEDTLPFLIIGRNAVREAVKSGRSIDYILAGKEPDGSLREILTMARERKLVIRECDRKKLDEVTMPFGHGDKPANHQGVVAYAAGVDYCEVRDILAAARDKGEEAFVIVLDGVTDPHNLGSIIRSAECAGAHGVVIGKRRSASVTAAAVKAAAGATEYVKIARVTNITAALNELKKAGLWIAGADMAGTPMDRQGLNGPLALVIGSEGDGIGKLVKDNCDFLVSIPLAGKIESLNAAVAAAVLMYEKKRQDAAE